MLRNDLQAALWTGLCVAALLAACDDGEGGGLSEPDVPVRVRRDRGPVLLPPGDAGSSADVNLATEDAGLDPDVAPDDPDDGVAIDAGELDPDVGELDPDVGELDPDAAELDPDAAELDPDAAPPEPDAGGEGPSRACLAALERANFDFENGPQGFTHQAMDGFDRDDRWRFDHWEHGQARSGPGRCVGGDACFATNLSGNYIQCQRAELRSPNIDLTACADQDVLLTFDHWYDFWAARVDGDPVYDGGTVEVGSGGRFAVLAPHRFPGEIAINPSLGGGYDCLDAFGFHVDGLPGFTQASEGWESVSLPFADQHRAAPFQVRFAYGTGVSQRTFDEAESMALNPAGWYVDNVRFELR